MFKRIQFKVSQLYCAAVTLEINSNTESVLSDKIINLNYFTNCVLNPRINDFLQHCFPVLFATVLHFTIFIFYDNYSLLFTILSSSPSSDNRHSQGSFSVTWSGKCPLFYVSVHRAWSRKSGLPEKVHNYCCHTRHLLWVLLSHQMQRKPGCDKLPL